MGIGEANVSGDGAARSRIRIIGPRACGYEGWKPGRRRRVWAGFTRLLGIAIGPEIPRTTVASVSIVAITLVVAVLERAIGSRTSVLKSIALTILPGGKASPIGAALTLALVRRSLHEWLWGVRRSARLGLKSLLRLRESVLPLRRRGETIRQPAKIAVIVQVVLVLSGRPLLTALCERLRGLRSGNKPKVMFGVLQVILRCNRISACVGISCELEVFFRDVMRVAAYFDVWSIRFIGSRQRIGASPIVRRPAAHPLVLTWSHFYFPISIRLAQSFSDRFRRKLSRIWRERDGSRIRVN